MVSLVLNDFWGNILWSATKSVGSISGHQSLDKAEISQFDVSIVAYQHILGLQISIDKVFGVEVL